MGFEQAASSHCVGQHAVIIGASMAGLLSARVLSEHFARVTLIERDRLEGMHARKGVPQGRQTHALLRKGADVVEELFPDLFPALLERGATEFDTADDVPWYHFGVWRIQFPSGIRGYSLSRPWLEGEIRQRVAERANVHVMDGYEVTRLTPSHSLGRIRGVLVRAAEGERREEELAADLVVDASGRGSQAPHWLKALGYGPVEETLVKVDVGYATRTFRRPTQFPADGKLMIIYNTPPQEKRIGVAFPIEGERWIVSVSGLLKDYPPSVEAEFLAYVRSLPHPALYELIKDAEPLSPVATMRFPANRRRHYERLSRRPEGFVVVGDALCSFNPIYGQGMTVAAIEAETLKTCLQQRLRRGGDMAGFAHQFQKAIAKTVSTAWMFTTSEDWRYPETGGKRPFGTGFFQWYIRRLLQGAATDARLALSFYQVMHMLKPPTILFAPRVLAGVLFRKAPLRDEQVAWPAKPASVAERAEMRELVGAAHGQQRASSRPVRLAREHHLVKERAQ